MLSGKTIFLRDLEPEDVNFLYQWENDCDNWEVSQTLVPFSRKVLTDYIDSAQDVLVHRQIRFIICLHPSNQVIGAIDLFDYDPLNLRIGIGILIGEEQHRKKGYATEAIQLIVNYSRNYLKIHQIHCLIDQSNEKSIRLFEKSGFKHSGTQKDWINVAGMWKNVLFYQLLLD